MSTIITSQNDRIRTDAENILSKITSCFYSKEKYFTLSPKKQQAWRILLKNIKNRIRVECPGFDVSFDSIDCLVTVTLNDLVVSTCTMVKHEENGHIPYFLIDTTCIIGSTISHNYLIQEAQRFSIYSGITLIQIKVPLKLFKTYIQMGYEPVMIQDLPNVPSLNDNKIVLVLSRANALYNNTLERQDVDYKNHIFDTDSERVLSLINGVLGVQAEIRFRHNASKQIEQWAESLRHGDMLDLISDGSIYMTRNILLPPSGHPPDEAITFHPRKKIGSVAENVERFMALIKIGEYDLKNIINRLTYDGHEFSKLCGGSIKRRFVKGIASKGGEKTVLTTEVSGTILSFCIISTKGNHPSSNQSGNIPSGIFEPWAYIELICSRKYAHIGSYMLKRSEYHAARNLIKTMRLSSVPDRVGWYYKMGYRFGRDVHDNDPDMVPDNMPYIGQTMKKLSQSFELFKTDTPITTTPRVKITGPLTDSDVNEIWEVLSLLAHSLFGKYYIPFKNEYPYELYNLAHETLIEGGKATVFHEMYHIKNEGMEMSKGLVNTI